MSIPPPMAISTPESQNITSNQRQIARSLLTALENLTAFDAFIRTIPSDPDALLSDPYGFSADDAYAIRLWGQKVAAYAAAFEDDAALADLTRRSAGVMLLTNQGM